VLLVPSFVASCSCSALKKKGYFEKKKTFLQGGQKTGLLFPKLEGPERKLLVLTSIQRKIHLVEKNGGSWVLSL